MSEPDDEFAELTDATIARLADLDLRTEQGRALARARLNGTAPAPPIGHGLDLTTAAGIAEFRRRKATR